MHNKNDNTMTSISRTFNHQSPLTGDIPDNNNNQKNEIYSLRQRKQRRAPKGNASNASQMIPSSTTKSNSVKIEIDTKDYVTPTRRGGSGGGEHKEKPKPKAAPLSKYRRKTANARERSRMREINCAFEHLRQCVPVSITGVETPSNNEKLTKITTLRLAMKYIRILSEILAKSNSTDGTNADGESTVSFNYQDIYNDILNDTLFKPTVTKPTGGRKELKKHNAQPAPPKVKKPTNRTRRKYTKQSTKEQIISTMNSIKKVMEHPIIPLLESSSSPMDIGLTLESDGESLQFSEPCLSPLEPQLKFTPDSLELGLLLESDGESLELSEPCLSPLSSLDSLNPFSDLLHTGFCNEQSIDMFLS